MRIILKNYQGNLRNDFRRIGYGEIRNTFTGETSFIKRLSRDYYPRFHLYAREEGGAIKLTLHLDQKKASYLGQKAHSGEYDSKLVEDEFYRIKRALGTV